MVDASDVRSLLSDRPDLEPAVEAVLELDEPWTFDDTGLDSGAFGELVAHDVVEECEDGYCVTDRQAIRSALERPDPEPQPSDTESHTRNLTLSVPPVEGVMVVGALVFVASLRLTSAASVFRDRHTVLTGNDPYYYRYLVERELASTGPWLAGFRRDVTAGEPLFVATLRMATGLAGGTPESAGFVLAWYPVVAAVVVGGLVYTLVTTLTDDRRVALAALLMFALTPGNAYRTSLGFADHHAFDYLWLAVTALAVTFLAGRASGRDTPQFSLTVVGVVTLAAGVAGQTLAWEAGPLLLVPIGVYLVVDGLVAVHAGRSPAHAAGPTLVGVGLGAAVTWTAHSVLGWHTVLVASAPALLFGGGIVVTVVAELTHRLDLGPVILVATEVGGAVALLVVASSLYPGQLDRLTRNVESRLIRTDAVAETGGLFGESFGWLLLFGFVFLLALPSLVSLTRRAVGRPRWIPIVVYAWYFLALTVVQVRFTGQLALFVAVFAGVGFVSLAAWVDVIDAPPVFDTGPSEAVRHLARPNRATMRSLVVIFLLVGSLSFVQIPVKTNQLTHSDAQYDMATTMADHADEHGLAHPDSYVFSQWGDNRFYNYFVNGESRSYEFARSNYVAFLSGNDSQRWYERLRDRVGFVVVSSRAVGNQTALGTRLYRADGSQTPAAPGLAHYRLIYVSEGRQYKSFTLVPGATISGTVSTDKTVSVSADVTIGSYTTTYERQVDAGADGRYAVTVPYATEYTIGNRSVVVPERAVQNGTTVLVE